MTAYPSYRCVECTLMRCFFANRRCEECQWRADQAALERKNDARVLTEEDRAGGSEGVLWTVRGYDLEAAISASKKSSEEFNALLAADSKSA